jgi:hypothetical protein
MMQKLPFLRPHETNITGCLEEVLSKSHRYDSIWGPSNHDTSARRVNNSTAEDTASASVLHCFGPINHWQSQSAKSLTRGIACPLLGFHTSCEDRAQLDQSGELLGYSSAAGHIEAVPVYRYGCTCNTANADDSDYMLTVIHFSMHHFAYPAELTYYETDAYDVIVDMDQMKSEIIAMWQENL